MFQAKLYLLRPITAKAVRGDPLLAASAQSCVQQCEVSPHPGSAHPLDIPPDAPELPTCQLPIPDRPSQHLPYGLDPPSYPPHPSTSHPTTRI